MKYDLRNGDILEFRGTDRFGKIIRWFTVSEFSHCAILLDSGDARTVGEALAQGFTIHDYGTDLDKLIETGVVSVYRYQNLTPVQFSKIKTYCYNNKGTPYDNTALTQIVVSRLTLGLMFYNTAKKLICSEAIIRAYMEAMIRLVSNKIPDYGTPGDIAKDKQLVKIY